MSSEEHPNAQIARRSLEAFQHGDLDTGFADLTDDVAWHVPGTNRFSGRFDGKPAVAARSRRMAEAGVTTRLEIHDVVANDEHVVALVHVHVEISGGRRYDQPQVNVMHLRDGKIAEFWIMNQDQAVLDELIG
jgi:ketosteroid isomerase-like protein